MNVLDRVPGYYGLHAWIKRRKPKPKYCERCWIQTPKDLANKSGKYLRDVDDWEYLCRSCHVHSDGRINMLRQHYWHRESGNPHSKEDRDWLESKPL